MLAASRAVFTCRRVVAYCDTGVSMTQDAPTRVLTYSEPGLRCESVGAQRRSGAAARRSAHGGQRHAEGPPRVWSPSALPQPTLEHIHEAPRTHVKVIGGRSDR